jgi:hypothetical protein
MHEFERCNSCFIFNGVEYVYGDGYDVFNRQEKFILAGLVPDYDNDLFFRPGYGALCFCCGDFNDLDNIIEVASNFDNFYNFPDKISRGYKFVIGPGISVDDSGNVTDFAVYCSNYKEILKWKTK